MADLNEKNIDANASETPAKETKPAKVKKPNFFVRMWRGIVRMWKGSARFIRDCISEMKKVTWLSRKETRKSSFVVLVVVIALSALIGIIDTALEFGILGLYHLI